MKILKQRWEILVGMLVLGGIAWLVFGGPMLVDFQTDVMTDQRVTIWNPLRNHEPESVATGYIRRIHVSNCSDAVAQLNYLPSDDKTNACNPVQAARLSSNCVLWQRNDNARSHEYWLNYHCPLVIDPRLDEEVEVTLKHVGEKWNLVGYVHRQY